MELAHPIARGRAGRARSSPRSGGAPDRLGDAPPG